MEIQTQRLVLREYLEEDWERVHIYGQNPEVSKYDVWGPNTVEDTKNFIKTCLDKNLRNPRMDYEFAVILKANNLLIGGARISRDFPGASVGNIGYVINPEFQSNGFATELTKEILNFGINRLKLKVIWATCDTQNKTSIRVLEKSGFQLVGEWKEHKQIKGKLRDSFRYEFV